MERSLILVKPDAVERKLSGTIISRLETTGMTLIAIKMLHIDRKLAERHYYPHRERSFFQGLINYITSGPVVAAVFEGENAISVLRKAMGATDPSKAENGTIRKDFGIDIEHNAIHGSDSVSTAVYEIGLYFSEAEIIHPLY